MSVVVWDSVGLERYEVLTFTEYCGIESTSNKAKCYIVCRNACLKFATKFRQFSGYGHVFIFLSPYTYSKRSFFNLTFSIIASQKQSLIQCAVQLTIFLGILLLPTHIIDILLMSIAFSRGQYN